MADVFRILTEIQIQVANKPELATLQKTIQSVTTDQQKLNATAAALRTEIAKTNNEATKQVLTTALKNTEVVTLFHFYCGLRPSKFQSNVKN